MSFERILAYILLIGGIASIIFALYSSHQIFTGNVEPPQLFKEPVQEKTASSAGGGLDVENLLQDQLSQMIPAGSISQTLNMSMWSVFATLLFFGGGQLAGIGIKLLHVKREQ
jgi:hypothetical protein